MRRSDGSARRSTASRNIVSVPTSAPLVAATTTRSRWIALEGAANVRDLGGLPLRGGGATAGAITIVRATAGAAVESLAENLTDSWVAPLCFYLVGGVPGAWGYRAVNTADARRVWLITSHA